MTPDFSEYIQSLIRKKPLESEDIRPLKYALRKYAEDYLDLKKGGNSQINLTATFTNDLKVADANDNFIRDIGRQMERSRDYVMHENTKQDGSKEIMVLPLERPTIEKYATQFSIGGIVLGALLSVIGGVLGDYLKSQSRPQLNIPKQLKISLVDSGVPGSTYYEIDIVDSAMNR